MAEWYEKLPGIKFLQQTGIAAGLAATTTLTACGPSPAIMEAWKREKQAEAMQESTMAQAAYGLAPGQIPAAPGNAHLESSSGPHRPTSNFFRLMHQYESGHNPHAVAGDGVHVGLNQIAPRSLQSQGLFQSQGGDSFEGQWTRKAAEVYGIGAAPGADAKANRQAYLNAGYAAQAMVSFEFSRQQLNAIADNPEMRAAANQLLGKRLMHSNGTPMSHGGVDNLIIAEGTLMRGAAHAGTGGLQDIMASAQFHPHNGVSFTPKHDRVEATNTNLTMSQLANVEVGDEPLRRYQGVSVYAMNKQQLEDVANSVGITKEELQQLGLYRKARGTSNIAPERDKDVPLTEKATNFQDRVARAEPTGSYAKRVRQEDGRGDFER